MMNFDLRPRVSATKKKKSGPTFFVGDKVFVVGASTASLNLYEKTKRAGLSYIHCPCNAKPSLVCTIEGKFDCGFIVRMTPTYLTVVHPLDLRKAQ